MAEKGENQAQDRTEPATPKRREDARKKGQVAKSTEVNSSAILLVSVLFFYFAGGYMIDKLSLYSRLIFENINVININANNLQDYLSIAATGFLTILLPFAGTIMVVGLAINLLQVGPLFTFEPIKPKFSKINPLSGIKRVLFSKKAFVELIKNIFKIVVVGLIAYYSIKSEIEDYVPLMDQSAMQVLGFVGSAAFVLGLKITAALIIIAILDFIFQKFDYEKSIRMTKQEIKEEVKQMEGDPNIKARIRSIQREMSRRRMMDEVPEADVVITNPVEVAIALKYTPGDMESPKVIAKGRKKVAIKIRKIALENDVPIVEDKPLAWALFKAVDVGDFIPDDLFKAVAEILAYVYRLKNNKTA